MTNPLAMADRVDGTLINADPGTTIVITVVVHSDPCPIVEWSFAGSILLNDSNYTVSNPCGVGNLISTFTLTIDYLVSNNSGLYSAIFSNMGGSANLPSLLVTVPGKLQSLSYSIVILIVLYSFSRSAVFEPISRNSARI